MSSHVGFCGSAGLQVCPIGRDLAEWWMPAGTMVCESGRMASQRAEPVPAQRAAAEVEAAADALVGIWAHVAVGRHGELNLSRLAEALDALPSSASRLCDR